VNKEGIQTQSQYQLATPRGEEWGHPGSHTISAP